MAGHALHFGANAINVFVNETNDMAYAQRVPQDTRDLIYWLDEDVSNAVQ